MIDDQLSPQQEQEVDEFFRKAQQKGQEVVELLQKNYKRYTKVMLQEGVTNVEEQLMIFGIFLLEENVQKDGYQHISVKKFTVFFQEFKKKMQND